MRDTFILGFKLLLITLVAGLALGFTNEVTKGPIAEEALRKAEEARRTVLPAAEAFERLEQPDGVDSAYVGLKGGDKAGYTATVTVKGYGGPIEVTVGMDLNGVVTGVNVGGSGFAETAGLGAKTKEPWFTEQFSGVEPPVVLGENVDAITAATISSRAVASGVNAAAEYMLSLIG